MIRAFILLGSNIGNRKEIIITALQKINAQAGRVAQNSMLYETAPWGIEEQGLFLNAVAEIETTLDAHTLLGTLLGIEKELGRTREVPKYGPRIIDIDILLYGNEVIIDDELTVPHPAMANRRFTLVPLAEIAGGLIHPQYNKSIDDLLAVCPDMLEVKPVAQLNW